MLEAIGKTEISDDNVSMLVQEQILQFEVSMNDLFLVDVPYPRYKLGE